jgi:formyl-CoA transferase
VEARVSRPLEGVLVVAVEQAVAAPLCTCRLADAGARVIKVERPEGDFARGYDRAAGGESAYFVWLNRGKESVEIDLQSDADKTLLNAMIGRADVLVQNLKPGAFARLGFSPGNLRAANPRLVACSISGYGEDGPYAGRKAYDLLVQAESGLASITGGPEAPARVGVSVVDIATGHNAYEAILEALIARERTGEGAEIHISMFDCIADWLTVPLLQFEGGMPPRRLGLAHPSIAPYGVFRTADGRDLLVAVQSDREWRVLCLDVLGRPELAADPRFATNVERCRRRAETDAAVAQACAALAGGELTRRLAAAEIAFADMNDMAGLATHPHLRRVAIKTPSGAVAVPGPPNRRSGYGPVPALGEHTARARAEFADAAKVADAAKARHVS